jgi:mannose-1-phosphate guanylyltransferase
MLHAVIMAGGSGTRFWPESREARPKQLLPLLGPRSMMQATVDRLGDLVPRERIVVATAAHLAAAVRQQLPLLSAEAILSEPCKRDTAPCIALAALTISRRDADATMVVLPSDQAIAPVEAFQHALRFAVALVDEAPRRIVVFGVRPTYPAVSFGYIERGEPLAVARAAVGDQPPAVFRAKRFREKPEAAVAQEYVATGEFYWNAGIFVWKASTILRAVAEHQPEMYRRLETIAAALGTPEYDTVLAREFAAIRPISIDYAVMEHAEDVVVVEATFDWDDLGSWHALARLRGADALGNTISARHLGLNTKGTIIRGDSEHLIVTVGLEDCIVVHTPDATLVASRRDEESLRRVVELLRDRGWTDVL